VSDVADVEATGCDGRGDEDLPRALLKVVKGFFTLPLQAVAVDRRGRELKTTREHFLFFFI
jgi:hypothetical protein